jgi:hypothetical protein
VRSETEILGRIVDPLPRVVAYGPGVIERAGNGRDGHTRGAGHVSDRGLAETFRMSAARGPV